MEEEKAHDSVVCHEHQPQEDATNMVDAGTQTNYTQEIISAPTEEPIPRDTTAAANIVEAAIKDATIQANEHQPQEDATNMVDAGTQVNSTQEIVSAQTEEPMPPDTPAAENTVEAASIQANDVRASLEEADNCPVAPIPARARGQPHFAHFNFNPVLTQELTARFTPVPAFGLFNPALGSVQDRIRELERIFFRDDQRPPRFRQQQHPAWVPHMQMIPGRHAEIPNSRRFFQGEPSNPASANKDVMSPRHVVPPDTGSCDIFPGAEEDHDNDWYDSIARDAQLLELEEQGLYGVHSEEQPIRSKAPTTEEPHHHCPFTVEDRTDSSSINSITKRCLSELDPEETGPSTERRTRVTPLNDEEVPMFDCGICFETLPVFNVFHGMKCSHMFCVECMATYIEGRVRSGEVPIPCPNPECRDGDDISLLHPEHCKKSIDFSAFCRWGNELTERAIDPNLRIYCPNRACGILLESTGMKTASKAPCPACKHLMCASCGSGWISTDGSGQHYCAEPLEGELAKLATMNRWKQCPRCNILVERTMGCRVMRCRCMLVFCYNCGGSLMPRQQGGVVVEMCQCVLPWFV